MRASSPSRARSRCGCEGSSTDATALAWLGSYSPSRAFVRVGSFPHGDAPSATTGQIEDFVGLSGAAFARCLISLIGRFRRLTELACRPLRRNAEAYPISAMARPAAQSWHHRANRMDKLQYIGVAPKATSELWIANNNEGTGFRYLIKVGNSLCLRVAVMHQPVLALEIWSGIGVEWLVSMKQDLALDMQELEGLEPDSGEFL